MSSFITTFVNLFTLPGGESRGVAIERIEIPLIQRDYAQGRTDPRVSEIRADFLEVLCDAVTGGDPVGLDFVYGDLKGLTFRPLDGQQRLTTLFLLHWYAAFRSARLAPELPWTQFRYATRASAELFCERIVANPPPCDVQRPSMWIVDQPWHLHIWRHDPTIQAMLVVIDALDHRLKHADMESVWSNLTSESSPAVWFHVLPIDEIGAGDELYIKMNSRGKPLTPFENFKARFEKALEGSPRAEEFADRVDGAWSDIMWRYRGSGDIVDDEFFRYFKFVTETAEWRSGKTGGGRLEVRAERAFGPDNSEDSENLDFLFQAFDAWVDTDIEQCFKSHIAGDGDFDGERVRFFGLRQVDLFRACCKTYVFGSQRALGWAETLTLYAVLLHRIHRTEDFGRRLRVLRNLIEASTNELRLDKMPALINDVELIVRADTIEVAVERVSSFNEAQLEDERSKAAFLASHPDLTAVVFALEDNRLLRGSLVAFDLDAARLPARAAAFNKLMGDRTLWPALTAALLATGDYSRHPNPRSFRLGSPEDDRWWRELLTGTKRSNLRSTSAVLAKLLDDVSASDRSVADTLRDVRQAFIDGSNSLDWRYYLVKYDAMREGKSGIYFAEGGYMGFRLCMLDKTQLNSWYRDPYLLAIWKESGVVNTVRDPWFTGYETDARWLTLRRSETKVRCVDAGFVLLPPTEASHREAYDRVCAKLGIGVDNLLRVPQVSHEGRLHDTVDRVKLGAELINDLVAADL